MKARRSRWICETFGGGTDGTGYSQSVLCSFSPLTVEINHVGKCGGNFDLSFVNGETGSEKRNDYSDGMELVKELELETGGPIELRLSQPWASCFSD